MEDEPDQPEPAADAAMAGQQTLGARVNRPSRTTAFAAAGGALTAVIAVVTTLAMLLSGGWRDRTAHPGGTVEPPATGARASHSSIARALPSQVSPAMTAPAVPVGALAALTATLARRSAAIRDVDASAWLADIDPTAAAFSARQHRTFEELSRLPIATWTYAYDGAGPLLAPARAAVLPPGTFVARVQLTYRLRDIDSTDVARRQYLTVVPRGSRWLLGDDTDGGAAATGSRDLWDLDAVRIVRGSSGIVIATTDHSTAELNRYETELRRAVSAVNRVWTSRWAREVLLVLPRNERQLGVLVDKPVAGLNQIAAFTTGDVQANGAVTGDRVVLNPTTFPALAVLARSIVLAHEVTHVATRALGRSTAPIWLTEGLADYVGYRDTGVPATIAAADLFAEVRAGNSPTSLPVDRDFDASHGNVSPAYNEAWLACRLIAVRYGERALVALYRAASLGGTAGLARDLRSLGTTEARFTLAWRHYVTEQAAL